MAQAHPCHEDARLLAHRAATTRVTFTISVCFVKHLTEIAAGAQHAPKSRNALFETL